MVCAPLKISWRGNAILHLTLLQNIPREIHCGTVTPKNGNALEQSLVAGKSLDSPGKGSVDKMSETCRKNVCKMSEKLPGGAGKRRFSDILWTIFAYLVYAFVW